MDAAYSKNENLTRRNFLALGWLVALGALFSQSILALVRFIKPVATGGFGGRVYAGKVNEFEVGSVSRILAGRFYVVRVEEGFLAMWQRCTHLGCAVPYAQAEGHFHCPCHGSLFSLVGEVQGGPAPRPLDLFPITIQNGEVWVDTSKPIERAHFDPSQITTA
jgi:cytochrome b6-f complex iron-sulfur subunit